MKNSANNQSAAATKWGSKGQGRKLLLISVAEAGAGQIACSSKQREKESFAAAVSVLRETFLSSCLYSQLCLTGILSRLLKQCSLFLFPLRTVWRAFSPLQYVTHSCEKAAEPWLLNTYETHLFDSFLPDKSLTFPMGENHRNMCEGKKMISLLFYFL